MENIKVESFGPIKNADVSFGDLTLLVGPQASGKSIFIQLIKLLTDKNHIRRTVEQYNFVWSKTPELILDIFFGSGMHSIWNEKTKIQFDNVNIDRDFVLGKRSEVYKNAEEFLFYIPAQRILSVSDGRAKFFTEFDESVPFVLRHFSETLRQLLQNDFSKEGDVFPRSQRLKSTLRDSFNESIFHNGKITMDNISGQRKFKMKVDGMNIPFMTWSAGQKEFMPLLLSFYWLCPASRATKRNSIKYVVIEEPEMGLHPKAIKSIILQILDLMSRGYKVIISTHSPVLLEFAWAFNLLKDSEDKQKALLEMFDLPNSTDTKKLFSQLFDKDLKTYYFERENNTVTVKNISSLDAGSEDSDVSGWGGISEFSGKTVDILSTYLKSEDE